MFSWPAGEKLTVWADIKSDQPATCKAKLLFQRHPLLQFLKPVRDYVDFARSFGFGFLHHQEALAVGADIPRGKIVAAKYKDRAGVTTFPTSRILPRISHWI